MGYLNDLKLERSGKAVVSEVVDESDSDDSVSNVNMTYCIK